jgi:hypothetical protein
MEEVGVSIDSPPRYFVAASGNPLKDCQERSKIMAYAEQAVP